MPPLFLGALIGLIVSVFIKVGTTIITVLKIVGPIFLRVFNVVKTVAVTIARGAGRFFRFIADAARGIYTHVLKPIADAARVFYKRFKDFLLRVFDPVIKIFDLVQRGLRWVWEKVIGPILDGIDKVRRGLRLLASIGVPFVAKLEAVLAGIQREIFERFRQIQNWVNTATFWLDMLLDPGGWIKGTPFLYSVFRFGGNMVNILTGLADLTGLNRARVEAHRQDNPTVGVDTVAGRVQSGEIRNSDAVQVAAARFRSRQSGRVA